MIVQSGMIGRDRNPSVQVCSGTKCAYEKTSFTHQSILYVVHIVHFLEVSNEIKHPVEGMGFFVVYFYVVNVGVAGE